MSSTTYRLMPPYGRFSVQDYQWKKPVEGLKVDIPMSRTDYVEVFVDGRLLKENLHYERVVEPTIRGILWLDSFDCPTDSWAILKVFKTNDKNL